MPPSRQVLSEIAPGHTSADADVAISAAASRPAMEVPGVKSALLSALTGAGASAGSVCSQQRVCMSASTAAAMCVVLRGERPELRAATDSAGCARLLLSSTILWSEL